MMVCIECGSKVDSLYQEFSKGNVRLTRCPVCSKVVDKYVEYDGILVLLDLVLLRAPAYRHLLFNRRTDTSAAAAMHRLLSPFYLLRLAALYTSLETWVKWTKLIEEDGPAAAPSYPVLFSVSLLELAAYLAGTSAAVYALAWPTRSHHSIRELLIALLVSSFGKCFLFLIMVWSPHYDRRFFTLFDLFVSAANVVGLQAFLGSDSLYIPVACVLTGVLFRSLLMYAL